jgi:hypothetical protein
LGVQNRLGARSIVTTERQSAFQPFRARGRCDRRALVVPNKAVEVLDRKSRLNQDCENKTLHIRITRPDEDRSA